ncbi:MAG: hypothetical protein QOD63_852 [Actinomycetota bacterium]|nr:hypothetical protein [Actinomycetota bacterium]
MTTVATTVPTTTATIAPTTTTTTGLSVVQSAFLDEARHLGGTGTNADLLNFGNGICLTAKSGAAEGFAVALVGGQPKAVRTQYALIITAAGDKLCPEYATPIILAASKVTQIPGP